jgi:phage terminase small subunit
MGALRDAQWERFANELAELKSPIEAYKRAGYAPDRGNANRLAKRAEVRARVRELLDEAAEFANIRRVRILVEIDRVGRANLTDFFEAERSVSGVGS